MPDNEAVDGPEAMAISEEEQQLHTLQRQLSEAMELAAIGRWEWDISSDTINWSDELYELYGVDKETFDTSFESFMQLIHPEDRELLGAKVQQAMENQTSYSVDHRLIRPDGAIRWVHGQGAVVAEDGKPVRLYGIAQDMTDLRDSHAQKLQLENAERNAEFRASLLAVVAHELNTPLTPLQLQTHLLMKGMDGLSKPQQRAIEIIDRNVRRLGLLVADVLDMSRSESGNLKLRWERIASHSIVQDTLDTFEVSAAEKGVKIDLGQAEKFDFEVDVHRVTQVLQNLVKNAIKFTPDGGTIFIRAKPHRGGALLEVTDTGRGLTKKKIENLFQPFSQVHKDQGSGGHGLGLFISKGIIEAHGGQLDVISDGDGKGSTFRFTIPARPMTPST